MKNMIMNLRLWAAKKIAPEVFERRDWFERAANTDVLTGLPNRRAFELAEPAALESKTAVFILFDANNFKRVNDELGHDEGDLVLKKIGKTIAEVAYRYSCRGFRLGGDEFVMICDYKFSRQIRDAVENRTGKIRCGGIEVSISGAVADSVKAAEPTLRVRKTAQGSVARQMECV